MTLDVQVLVIAFLAISLRLAVERSALDPVQTKDSDDSNRSQPQATTQANDCQIYFSATSDSNVDESHSSHV
jgi:hypothetical protein